MIPVQHIKPLLRLNTDGRTVVETIDAGSSTPLKDLILTPHPQHYIKEGDVTFVVEKTLYRVHTCFFTQHSTVFAALLKSEDSTAISGDSYIQLAGVGIEEFETFLSVIYPAELGVIPERKEKEWRHLLSFASAFNFTSLITTALVGLDKYLQPTEKVLLGDQLGIPELTSQGIRVLCTRKTLFSSEEGRALGLENVMCITRLREETLCYHPDKVAKLTDRLISGVLAQRLVKPAGGNEGVPNLVATVATVANGAGAASKPPNTATTAGVNSSTTGSKEEHQDSTNRKKNGDQMKFQTEISPGGKDMKDNKDASKGANASGKTWFQR